MSADIDFGFDPSSPSNTKISYPNGDVYIGSVHPTKMTDETGLCLQIKHGIGKMTYKNGETFVGSFLQDLRSGLGNYKYPIGDTYHLHWSGNIPTKQGKHIGYRGLKYTGEFNENLQFHGRGILQYPTGKYYVGLWVNGKRHGIGQSEDGKGDYYIGQFQNDLYHGLGELEYGYGDKYMGEFRDGTFNGRGTFKLVIFFILKKLDAETVAPRWGLRAGQRPILLGSLGRWQTAWPRHF